MGENLTYSLWLLPDNNSSEKLRKTIRELAKQNDSPEFEPHITLVGSVQGPESEALRKTAQMASRMKRFTALLERLDVGKEYVKCVYAKIQESPELLSANKGAQKLFGKNEGYSPHLSLVYSDMPLEKRRELVGALGGVPVEKVMVNSLALYSTTGPVETWFKVGEFPLN